MKCYRSLQVWNPKRKDDEHKECQYRNRIAKAEDDESEAFPEVGWWVFVREQITVIALRSIPAFVCER